MATTRRLPVEVEAEVQIEAVEEQAQCMAITKLGKYQAMMPPHHMVATNKINDDTGSGLLFVTAHYRYLVETRR